MKDYNTKNESLASKIASDMQRIKEKEDSNDELLTILEMKEQEI